jgi:phospho-N-acetylmuramoyl-pentapeptide-transferase
VDRFCHHDHFRDYRRQQWRQPDRRAGWFSSGRIGYCIAALGVLAYLSGNSVAADFLNILYIPYSGELVIFSACLLGGCIGFLWYNVFPARSFMGDTGSLTLGGIIAALAIIMRKELLDTHPVRGVFD